MRVLITGATGFVGTHLAEYLSTIRGIELFGLRRPSSEKAAARNMRIFSCDIRDNARLRKILKKTRPQRIFHLAASASVAR